MLLTLARDSGISFLPANVYNGDPSRVHNGQIRKDIRVYFLENGKPMPYLASDDARWDIGLWDMVYSWFFSRYNCFFFVSVE